MDLANSVWYKQGLDYQSIFVQVNNAGAALMGGLATTSLEGFDKMYNINVRSVVMVTQKAMPKIIENKGAERWQ